MLRLLWQLVRVKDALCSRADRSFEHTRHTLQELRRHNFEYAITRDRLPKSSMIMMVPADLDYILAGDTSSHG